MTWRYFMILVFALVTVSMAAPLPNVKVNAKIKAAGTTISLKINLFSGLATWFTPDKEGGPMGACGPKEGSSDMIVALNAHQYGPMNQKSKYCGRKIQITGPSGKTATAIINDACPGCKEIGLAAFHIMNGNANYLDTTQLFGFPLSDYGFGSETTGLEYSILSNMLQSPGELPASSDAQTASTTTEAPPLASHTPTTADISSQGAPSDQTMAMDTSIWPDPKPMDTPPTITASSSPFAVPQGSPSANSPQQQKPTHYAMTKRDSVSSSGGGRRKGGSGNTPEAVYAGVKRPFNYAEGFHYLIQHVRDKMGREDLMRISRALALFRPSFIALIMNLTEEDLVFMEKCLQRTLLEYEKLISFSGTPTVVWRRTGEICLVGKEFSLLTNWSKDALLGKKKYIYELMDNQSAVEYWEKFAMHAFDNTESCAFTTCILLSPTNRPVPCTFCFSIKRDIFDLPSVIVGNFLPILS